MADTIVNNTPAQPREERSDGTAGWAVAVIILLAIILVGGYYLLRHRGAATPASTAPASVQINLPSAGSNSSGGTTQTQ